MPVADSSRETARVVETPEAPSRPARSRRQARLERASSPIGRLLRYGGLFIGALVGWSFGGMLAARPELVAVSQLFLAAVLAGLGFLTTPYIVFDLVDAVVQRLRRLTLEALLVSLAGAFVGALLGLVLAWPLALLPRPAGQIVPSVVALLTTVIGALVAHSKQSEVLAVVGRKPPASEPVLVLDTSVLIDGRVRDLLRLGFLDGRVLVPEEVLRELHLLAEHDDPSRRARGRRGLELVRRLREELGSRLEVVPAAVPPRNADDAVVARASEGNGKLLTCDQQLADLARVRGIVVLNPNQLAEALRSPIHAGDRLTLRLAGEGREAGQAIGYLEDGTLVIVERARHLIGQDVTVEVTRTLQTAGGRLVFAHLVEQGRTR
ncbi:putative PIN and TRAM-domain containing protein YacL [bacterium HR27]|nr:putative PIN and TRAM-domain containing protein YacL [bacterium HR27]